MRRAKSSITAADAVARMKDDLDYQERRTTLERTRAEAAFRHASLCAPLLKDLADIGFLYDSLDDLRKSRRNYREAVPILLKWLRRIHDYEVKESIVRTLTVPWAKPDAAGPFISEFRGLSGADAQSLKWAIGNGLTVVADETVVDDLIELATDPRHGKSREMIAIALGNMKDARVADVLVSLLHDEQVAGHAIVGLGKLKSPRTRPSIEPFVNHSKAWIRSEAKKAIARIEKASMKSGRVARA